MKCVWNWKVFNEMFAVKSFVETVKTCSVIRMFSEFIVSNLQKCVKVKQYKLLCEKWKDEI